MFTRNQVKAAPVLLSRRRIESGRAQAILVNSGNANACTGDEGYRDAERATGFIAQKFGAAPDTVLVASTGVIGKRLNLDGIEQAVPLLAEGLSDEKFPEVAKAIMTTDTFPKLSAKQDAIDGKPFVVAGVGKGAGMMRPDMATMLVFILTDLAMEPGRLRRILETVVDRSFHRINIDGDTSTNDTVIALASGAAGNSPEALNKPGSLAVVEKAFEAVADDLARMMVKDAEGATKFAEITVRGAYDEAQARTIAHTVAESKLVKTAFFGEDANWGRIMAAVGRSGARLDPAAIDLFIDDVQLVQNGLWLGPESERDATQKMKNREFQVIIDVKQGDGQAKVYTCDLSYDYVRINAEYRT